MTLGPPERVRVAREWGHAKVRSLGAAQGEGLTMCVALPARVLAIEADHAVVDLDGRVRHASLMRMPEVGVGDWALVAAGAVLRRLDPDEAAEIRELLRHAMPQADPLTPGGPR